jgi:hypothetical protein
VVGVQKTALLGADIDPHGNVFKKAPIALLGGPQSQLLVSVFCDVPVDVELGQRAVEVFDGHFYDAIGSVKARHVDFRMGALAIFKNLLGLAPGAHHIGGVDHFVAFPAHTLSEHRYHGLVHEFYGVILTGNIDAVFHGIQDVGQFVRCFHGVLVRAGGAEHGALWLSRTINTYDRYRGAVKR